MRISLATRSCAFLSVLNITLGAVIHNRLSHIIQLPFSHLPALHVEPPEHSINLTISGNDIKTFFSISTLNDDYHIDCDGRKCGFRLDIIDCLSALMTIKMDLLQINFLDRTNPTVAFRCSAALEVDGRYVFLI